MTSSLLTVEKLQAGYGASQVLFDINFEVAAGEVITLLGRNGMGKSTTVKCLSGLLKPRSGQIFFNGQATHAAAPHVIGQLGLGLVPEGRQVFPTLTVHENLVATASDRHVTPEKKNQMWTLDRVNSLFPRLKERSNQLAGKLSGGEQQMLAVGRALMTNPKLVVLDEATEGLAPLIRQEIWACLQVLKNEGQAMIVIDKNLKSLIPLANHHYVIEKGTVVWSGGREKLLAEQISVENLLKA
jgi:branched-chain amino acid transport system ATP-binding protein